MRDEKGATQSKGGGIDGWRVVEGEGGKVTFPEK